VCSVSRVSRKLKDPQKKLNRLLKARTKKRRRGQERIKAQERKTKRVKPERKIQVKKPVRKLQRRNQAGNLPERVPGSIQKKPERKTHVNPAKNLPKKPERKTNAVQKTDAVKEENTAGVQEEVLFVPEFILRPKTTTEPILRPRPMITITKVKRREENINVKRNRKSKKLSRKNLKKTLTINRYI